MTSRPKQSASDRGIALVVVLLLMAVLSGLATGFAITGQTEVQMGTNEVYFAGARAAAEAGLNRALVEIFADTTTNWIAGSDGVVDAGNTSAAVNADNGSLFFLLGAGPYYVDPASRYSYEVQILDDDNDLLYETPLTAAQRTAMGEDGNIYTNINQRVVLRAIGYGPSGTTVRIGRIIESVATTETTPTTTTVLANPAILVNGDFTMDGTIRVEGTSGSVHANGNLLKTGICPGTCITGSATASGTYTGPTVAAGATGGGRPTVNVPNINAADYISQADFKLTSAGTIQTLQGGVWTDCSTGACSTTGFTFSGGNWAILGNSAGAGTYYVEGNVSVSGSPKGPSNTNLPLSIIATGSIDVSGSPKFMPENDLKLQFVSNQDIKILGNSDLAAGATVVEGQIMAKGQFDAGGNMEFQGRVLVEDVQGAGTLIANGGNSIHGGVRFSYNGTLGAISTTTTTTTTGPTTYVNNVSGWMEQ